MQVQIKVLDERLINETMPNYATDGAAAIDLRACRSNGLPITCETVIQPGASLMVGTGIAIHLGGLTIHGENANNVPNYSIASLILPRSGLGAKQGIVIGNLVGLIDSDYQGELIACVWNRSNSPFVFNPLDRLAQMVIIPVLKPDFVIVEEFCAKSVRGAGGFGSTGNGVLA